MSNYADNFQLAFKAEVDEPQAVHCYASVTVYWHISANNTDIFCFMRVTSRSVFKSYMAF